MLIGTVSVKHNKIKWPCSATDKNSRLHYICCNTSNLQIDLYKYIVKLAEQKTLHNCRLNVYNEDTKKTIEFQFMRRGITNEYIYSETEGSYNTYNNGIPRTHYTLEPTSGSIETKYNIYVHFFIIWIDK